MRHFFFILGLVLLAATARGAVGGGGVGGTSPGGEVSAADLTAVQETAEGAAEAAADAQTDADAALLEAQTGTVATTRLEQTQDVWTGTPTITTAADVNGKLFRAHSATNFSATLPAGIAADVFFSVAVTHTGSVTFISDGTSVILGPATLVGAPAENGAGGIAYVVSEGSDDWRIHQGGGTITLGENTSIALDPAGSADGIYTGVTITGTAGATLAFGDLIYLDPTDSRWELVDANSAAAADGDARGLVGMCVLAAAADGSATNILLHGTVRADTAFPALTINAPVYPSETAGDIVVAAPTTPDAVVRIVGYAKTADEITFAPGAYNDAARQGSNTGTHASPSTSNPLALSFTAIMHSVWYGATGEIDLPAAASYTGRAFVVYNTGAFTVTLDPNASEVIVRDGTAQTGGVSMTLSSGAGNYVALISDGARWITLGFKGTLAAGS